MATLDKAEQLEERLVISSAQQGVSASLRLTTETGKRLTRWSGTAVKKTGVGMARTVAYGHQALSESLREMADGIRERAHEKEWGSEVPLEEFTETVDGKREVVELEDNELVEEVRQELRKHNVTFAVEQDEQDRFYLHVRGNDANLIAHALDRAQERLDEVRTRDEPTQDQETPDRNEGHERTEDTPDRDERHTPSTEDELTAHEEAELNRRTGAPDDLEQEQAQARSAFEGEWEFYRDGHEAPLIDINEQGSRIAAAEPTVTLTTEQSGPGTPTRDGGGVRVDQRGDLSVLEGHNIESISPQDAATRLGVSETELSQAVTAASAGLAAAQDHGERAETLYMQQRVEDDLAVPDLADAEHRFERANDPTLASLPEGYENVTPDDARQQGPAPTATPRREPQAHDRPTVGQDNARPQRAEGRGRGPERSGLDSRERSKAAIRDKISHVADRLQRSAGRDNPTQVRGLEAHKKGPTR